MRSRGIRPGPVLGWALVDPSLATPEACVVPQTLLALANTNWATAALVDVEHPPTERFLTNHRVSTLLRTEDVLPEQREGFRRRLLHIAGMQLRIEAVAAEVLALFADHGIESRVLKGLASAELDYPDRSLRQTGDVDLAVRREQFEQCMEVLLDAGYRHHEIPRAEALLKGATLDSPAGIEVDLHTRLFQRSGFTDELFAAPEQLSDLDGFGLSPAMRMVHAAGHFLLAPPGARRMSGLVDITMLRRRHDFELDAVRLVARQLGIEGLVRAALTLEARLSNVDAIEDQLESWAPTSWLDRKTRLVIDRNLVLDHLARFREVPVGDRLGYLPSWLLPDRRERQILIRSLRARTRSRRPGSR